MSEAVINHIRRWKWMANVILHTDLNHDHRAQRVEIIRRMILRLYDNNWRGRPQWVEIMLEILAHTHHESGYPSYITHIDAKNTLRLFMDTCDYLINRWSEWYAEDLHKFYDYTKGKEVETIKKDDFQLQELPF